MEIKVTDTICDEETLRNLADNLSWKFVLVEEDGRKQLRIFTAGAGEHMTRVELADTLIGAGIINAGAIEWGSHSCMGSKGYDRPEDLNEANRILNEVAQAFAQWKKKI